MTPPPAATPAAAAAPPAEPLPPPATLYPPVPATPAKKSRGRAPADRGQAGGKTKGRADRTVRVPEAVRPEPVRPSATADLPRTARPAEVVHTSRSSPEPSDLPKGRRARKRAAKLAAERAELEERLERQRERDSQSMGKREREHVAWVQRLVNMPTDPTLETRKK
jgi:hypothetical protein